MWHYFWLHKVYHIARLCPKHRTRKCPLVFLLLLLTVCTLIPHMYLIVLPTFYRRFCPYPLHSLLVLQVMFSLVMVGFCVLFVAMEPVVDWVKWAFHVYGLADLAFDVGFVITFFLSQSCLSSGDLHSVYTISLITVVATLLSLAYFLVLVPFWIWNVLVSKGSIVDLATKEKPEKDTSLCNGLIQVVPCVWHI